MLTPKTAQNLKHLNIYVDMKEDDYCFRRVLQYVSNAQGTESLKRLINVRLIRTFYTRNEDDLWFVKAFTALPSVKNIECETMENAVTHSDLAIKLHARSSNVETLTFNCGAGRGSMDMDNKDFVELFEGFKALKMFTYDCGFHSRPTGVHTALFAHARHSLETLILRSHDPDKKPLGSFRSFEVLKKLEISHTHLVDDRGPGRTRLAHVLPSSLEELHLHDLRYVASVQLNPLWFGQELLEDKDTCLPKLKIAVDCDDYEIWRHGHKELAPDYDRTTPGIADLQAACNAKGFRLEIPER